MVRSLFLYRVFQLVLTIACTFSLTTILYACFCPVSALVLPLNIIHSNTYANSHTSSYLHCKARCSTYYIQALTSTTKKAMKLIIAQTPILPLVIPCDNSSPHLTHYLTFLHSPLTHYTYLQALIALCFDTTSYLTSNLMVTSTHAKTHHR